MDRFKKSRAKELQQFFKVEPSKDQARNQRLMDLKLKEGK